MISANGRPPESLEPAKTGKQKPVRRAKLELVKDQSNREEPPKEEEGLPAGFSFRTRGALPGLWHVKEGDEPVETWIGPTLHILGATRDERGNAWGLLLEWDDPDGRRHTWAMPKSMLVGRDNSAWMGRLADEGWSGAPGANAKKLLALYLSTHRTERRALCVPCTGWHHGAFVLPDAIIQNTSDASSGERIVLQVQTAHNPFQFGGTPAEWKATIGKWARGNSRLMLALCASLAAPLLQVAGQESGGFNWMGQSSTGKTTALVAAGSIWGKGASSGGYVQNWRATSNGLEGLAALHSDAALCLDEIGQAPGRTISEAAYMLANGMGKQRATQDGSAKDARSWRCMVLSTGEKGLADKILEEGGRVQAGQTVRLVDVPADAGAGMGIFENLHGHKSPRAFADAIKNAAATNYGHVARAFISEILSRQATVAAELHEFLIVGLSLLCPDKASGQVQRVARRFLLCAAAGEMAAEWGLLPWVKGEALEAVKTCFNAWLALRGGSGAAEDTAIINQVTLFIEQHGASRFQDIDQPDAACVNRAGFYHRTEEKTEYFFLPASFKELCKGFTPTYAAHVLRDAGLLLVDGEKLQRKPPHDLPGLGRPRCYVLSMHGEGAEK
jgi:putative DNA primase/helicase